MNDRIATLRAQLEHLEALHKGGQLRKPDYDRQRLPLERQLLDRVMDRPGSVADTTASAPAAERPSTRLVASLAALVLGVAVAGYFLTGSPQLATGPVPSAGPEAASPHEGGDDQQFAAAVDSLARKLNDQPDNAEGWAMLARSYTRLGRFTDAVPAFAKALSLRGDDVQLLADYADALAVTNNRNLEGEPLKLVERALKADPKHVKSLALAGTAAFNRNDFAGAVRYWERLAAVAPPDPGFREQVQGMVAEARQRAGMAPAAVPVPGAGVPQAAAQPAPVPGAATTGPGVRGSVRLAAALAQKAAPDDTVFIVARAAEGPRMPLAILRKQVKDLPLEFALGDAMAMTPETRLSLFPKIVIDARVTKSGLAQPGPGDLTGRSAPVANDAGGVNVEINQVIGQ